MAVCVPVDPAWKALPIETQLAIMVDALWAHADAIKGLPAGAVETLIAWLEGLNAGQVDPLVRTSRPRRYGKRPWDGALFQMAALELRAFRIARGEREADVEAKIAGALGRTPQIFDQWRRDLPKTLGVERVREGLEYARHVGQRAAAGETALVQHAIDAWDSPDLLARLAAALRQCR